ncbi:glycosyltransferase family 2 [Flavobacterium phage vB_FspM_immuto_3-5A]|uniref:Glycosyltransferase family 2 n=1 Tax=Flavobacterium phage vB_FspM_immuto_2-6A TaxID=2801477 RepID=A0A7T8IWX7_9CAUD|nr:glycosyltransferase family 2 [Flavobacterium phage vB_FspM_immuto_2-6A]QQO91772.1 glycosyltransferase family 2 [Flavobacterium phage vB_FspM_immuto_2-6A]QQO92010.1 glycosyltransferase family 2 [Flavobacterium phage vB_FspM_immuto_3-5A]QQO92248.1 glycosyltransferase family 2 [Flavobacterium phage vB_FspM_immuto_13-6C]
MKISYAITVCNELEEVKRLVTFLHHNKRQEDEIVVLADSPKMSQELQDQLYRYSSANWIKLIESKFEGHFADWKNLLTSHCTGNYIFQIDADEMITEVLIGNLPTILESNPGNEVFLVPRVNTVTGLTQEHITKWRWNVDEEDRVNWPDYQWRIWKKKPEIKWVNKVHERLEGFKTYAPIPALPDLALQHPKTIERQERQNDYYDTL